MITTEIGNTRSQNLRAIVTLVLPIYASNEKILPTLLSIKHQTEPPDEVVIVDDNPTIANRENFLRVILGKEVAFHYIKNVKNLGSAASLNLGISHSSGSIILLCNDDDLFESSRNSAIKRFLLSAVGDLNWGFTSVRCIDDHGNFLDSNLIPSVVSEAINLQREKKSTLAKLENNNIVISTGNLFFSKKIWERVGGFNVALSHVHDWEVATKFAILSDPLFIEGEQYLYRLHDNNSYKRITPEESNLQVTKLRLACEEFFWEYGNMAKLNEFFSDLIIDQKRYVTTINSPSILSSQELRILHLYHICNELLSKHPRVFGFLKFIYKKFEMTSIRFTTSRK
jgi:glycosyltransferase involved in cell wall biosynthesis